MKAVILCVFISAFVLAGPIDAQEIETFEMAKSISAEAGRPILLEFVHED